ncbi:MAG: GtrA family protein [Chloroflexi bacterium]|nr:GtrA family protein [Chloroflexota bacterium]
MTTQAAQRFAVLVQTLTSRREIFRFIKYALVGSSGLIIGMGLLWVLVEYLGMVYIAASLLSGEIGITLNFLGYEVWTFRDVKRSASFPQISVRWLKYNLVRATGIGISLGILTLLVEVFNVHYFIANIIGTGVAIVLNYAFSIGWIWRITHSRQ